MMNLKPRRCNRNHFVFIVFVAVAVVVIIVKRFNYHIITMTGPSVRSKCSVPSYITKKMKGTPWYPIYLSHLKSVNLKNSSETRRLMNCARWWHPTPQWLYDELPDRGPTWKPTKMPENFKRPKCSFGQELVPKTHCIHQYLLIFEELDKLGLIYYVIHGTELGILRHSSYLSSDGDIDIFVDYPQEKLLQIFKKLPLKPPVYMNGKGNTRGVDWKPNGCPRLGTFFSDWSAVEMRNKPKHADMCTCFLNSIPVSCHRDAAKRMYHMYGPAWKVPMHTKQLDLPIAAYKYNSVGKLNSMVSNNGLIVEESVRALDRTIIYSDNDMKLILAQLNIQKALIDVQQKKKKDWNAKWASVHDGYEYVIP